jgi:hypothetical protein
MRNILVLGQLLTVMMLAPAVAEEQVDFNRDVRPILANHCWQCHGFDEHSRQAGLRLDIREQALKPAESGEIAIIPGNPDHSELMARVTAGSEDVRMPPRSVNKPLSATQVETLRRWITEGAEYQRHWAFEPLKKPDIPSVEVALHPIDAFVAANLTRHGLQFATEAQRETLLRRVSFDLTGLPPTLEELDRVDEPYENAVDRLLNSPHFGERMAVDWLDAARYADTNGYFSDKPRQMWLWRDWVIDAFNRNMPFDQFTIEQLAGDLLPNSTISQRIATGFNRNHVANNETGIIDEEFRTEYVVDRVDTTMTTWLGLTAACAQCHDHKFDPISQREFYQLFAFFNNVPETGLIVTDNPPPLITVTTPEQDCQLAELTAAASSATSKFEPLRSQLMTEIAAWESDAINTLPSHPEASVVLYEPFDGQLDTSTRSVGTKLVFQAGVRGQAAKFDATQHAERVLGDFDVDGPWSIGFWISPENSLSCPLSKIDPEGNRQGLEFLWQKGRLGINLVEAWGVRGIEILTQEPVRSGQWHHVVVCYDGSRRAAGLNVLIDGAAMACDVRRDSLTGSIASKQPLRIGRRDSGLGYYGLLDELRIVQKSLSQQEVADWFHSDRIRGILETAPGARGGQEIETLLDYYIEHFADTSAREVRLEMKRTQRAEKDFRDAIPTTLVMQEMPQPRTARVLNRGQYDHPGDVVSPGVPAAISGWPDDAPLNRLGLSQWLVSDKNPLTARVAVNRLWKQCFGEGLVRTMNDFGTQGELPTHPELLDWLAVTFQESGWDVKGMLRLIVTSRTYRQDSAFKIDGATIVDSQNRMLARGPSFRMPAEMIRDQALAVSGLLRRQIGGPSVKPYQPPGLWEEVSYNAEDTYVEDPGDGLWRRSMYTYLKRQVPPPSFLAFDGITREKCNVQRARTNTPLQSLILLNDPTFVEASRVLASLVLQAKSDDRDRLTLIFRRVLSRHPEEPEVGMLEALLQRQRQRFSLSPDAAKSLLVVGESKCDELVESSELAAWTVVAHTLLNLDEAITRR